MRSPLPTLLAPAALLAMAVACDAPLTAEAPGAAMVQLPAPLEPLPEPVQATVIQLRQISATGGYRDMARLADATPGFRSNAGDMSHQDYWYLKLRTGDWPMAHVGEVLSQPYGVTPTAHGNVYVWPSFATLPGEAITPADARAIDALIGEGQADLIRNGGKWPGYVLGIAEDGTWLYFISGEG